jgi:hypothetical protein
VGLPTATEVVLKNSFPFFSKKLFSFSFPLLGKMPKAKGAGGNTKGVENEVKNEVFNCLFQPIIRIIL